MFKPRETYGFGAFDLATFEPCSCYDNRGKRKLFCFPDIHNVLLKKKTEVTTKPEDMSLIMVIGSQWEQKKPERWRNNVFKVLLQHLS